MVRWGRWWHSWSASPIGSCRIASGGRREGTVHRAPRQPGLRFGQALLAWLPRDHAATGAGEIDFEQPRMRRSQCEGEADLGAIPLHEEQMSSYVIAEQRVEAWVRWGNTSPSWTAGPLRRAAPTWQTSGPPSVAVRLGQVPNAAPLSSAPRLTSLFRPRILLVQPYWI